MEYVRLRAHRSDVTPRRGICQVLEQMPPIEGLEVNSVNLNLYIVKNIVEYIGSQGVMPFDVIDIEESLDEVLAYYDLHPEFEHLQFMELRKELVKVALKAELAEMARIIDLGVTSGIDRVKRRLYPGIVDGFARRRAPVAAVRNTVAEF